MSTGKSLHLSPLRAALFASLALAAFASVGHADFQACDLASYGGVAQASGLAGLAMLILIAIIYMAGEFSQNPA